MTVKLFMEVQITLYLKGKKFKSVIGYLRVNGSAVTPRYTTIGKVPLIISGGTNFTLDTGPAQINCGFSGYLIDENRSPVGD